MDKYQFLFPQLQNFESNIDKTWIVDNIDSICAISGQKITRGVKRDKALSSTFTDWGVLKFNSNYLSIPVFLTLGLVMAGSGKKLIGIRMKNFIATTSEIKFLASNELELYILSPPTEPFILSVTYDHKKHTIFNCDINYNQKQIIVGTDVDRCLVDVDKFRELNEIASRWYTILPGKESTSMQSTYFNKAQIASGEAIPKQIQEYGLNKWIQENEILSKYRNTTMFKLLVHTLTKKHAKNTVHA